MGDRNLFEDHEAMAALDEFFARKDDHPEGPTMTDKTERSRAEFEEVAVSRNYITKRHPSGEYCNPLLSIIWPFWLAAWSARAPAQDERGDAGRTLLRIIKESNGCKEVDCTFADSEHCGCRLEMRAELDADREKMGDDAVIPSQGLEVDLDLPPGSITDRDREGDKS
jgi:hypothetical protein